MPSNIQENIARKAEREALVAQTPDANPIFTDTDLCVVLHGFGKVLPTATSYLDGFEVKGGVIKDVPYSIAKHWLAGTRPDGGRPQGKVKVTILPKDASEDDFARAAGLTSDERRRMAAVLSAGDAVHLIEDLGPDRAKKLRDALSRYLEAS